MNTGYPQAVRRMKEQRLQMPHDPPDHVAAPVPCNKRCARPHLCKGVVNCGSS